MESGSDALPTRVSRVQDKDSKKTNRYDSSKRSSGSKQCILLPKQRSHILSDTDFLPPQKKLKTGIHTRAPLIDLDRNIIKTSEAKKVEFKDKILVTSKEFKIDKFPYVCKSLTPVITDDTESDEDKSESSKQNPDKNWAFLSSLNDNKHFSPIRSNAYTAKSAVISQGIPEKVKRPTKKLTLLHRYQLGVNRQNVELKCWDNYYHVEYLEDIILHQLKNDWKYVVARNFLKLHNSHNNENRAIVINWIIQAQDYFNLPASVLFTTIRLFDKLLENIFVPSNMCQLVGLVLTWIFSKYEDNVNVLMVSKMIALSSGVFTEQQFLKMEIKILTFFNFDINIPDVTIYVAFYIRELNMESELLTQCVYYILECYTLTIKFSTDVPSVQAAAAVHLALNILYPSLKVWNKLEKVIGYYAEKEIVDITNRMLHQLHKTQDPEYKYRQPYHKYSTKEKAQASIVLLHKLVAS